MPHDVFFGIDMSKPAILDVDEDTTIPVTLEKHNGKRHGKVTGFESVAVEDTNVPHEILRSTDSHREQVEVDDTSILFEREK